MKPKRISLIYTISFILILQLINTSCSRKSYPDSYTKVPGHREETTSRINNTSATDNTPIRTSNKALQNFLAAGHGKKLATGRITPDDLIGAAREYMGVRHCMGGTSHSCIDCSGLVMKAFENNGIGFPHNSQAQARYGKIILDKYKLKKGDLVYFINTYNTSKYITHTGICIGNNQFIHTSSSKGVIISSLDNSYWKTKFIFGTEIF